MEDIQSEKIRFAEQEILFLVFQGALSRGYPYLVYKPDTKLEQRTEFKEYLAQQLKIFAERCGNSKQSYFEILSAFHNEINRSVYVGILKDDRITFGRVQKLLNLYLKYWWIFGCNEKPKPSHCPIDSIILGKIGWHKPTTWTMFDKDEYHEAIRLCKNKAGEMDLAEWELQTFRSRADIHT